MNKRLSAISSSKKEFDDAKESYQKALNESGYKHKLEFRIHPKILKCMLYLDLSRYGSKMSTILRSIFQMIPIDVDANS